LWRAYLRAPSEGFGGFDYRDRSVVVVGIPIDFTSSYRSGSRFAPSAIREVSQSIELCSVCGNCVVEEAGIDDLGDLVPVPGDVERSLEIVEEMAMEIAREGKRIIAIGGDHTVTQALYSGVSKGVGEEPCILVIDAHLDLRNELVGRYSHATCMRRLLERAQPPAIVWFGVRAFSSEELKEARRIDVPHVVVKSIDVLRDPSDAIARASRGLECCRKLYLSIDVDGFDPAFAPGVQTPEPVGIHPIHFVELLQSINVEVVAADIVEVSPPYDRGGSTAALGARLVVEIAAKIYEQMGEMKVRGW